MFCFLYPQVHKSGGVKKICSFALLEKLYPHLQNRGAARVDAASIGVK